MDAEKVKTKELDELYKQRNKVEVEISKIQKREFIEKTIPIVKGLVGRCFVYTQPIQQDYIVPLHLRILDFAIKGTADYNVDLLVEKIYCNNIGSCGTFIGLETLSQLNSNSYKECKLSEYEDKKQVILDELSSCSNLKNYLRAWRKLDF